MNKYMELKDKHQKEISEFPMFFAFSGEQFEEGLKKFGFTLKDYAGQVVSVGMSGFVRKTDIIKFYQMFDRHEEERNEARKDDEYIYQMFRYELSNHEYCITYDFEDTLDSLDLTWEEVQNDPRLRKALLQAKEDYLNAVYGEEE